MKIPSPPLAAFCCYLATSFALYGAEQDRFSELWGDPAAPVWSPGINRLPDFTNVGYQQGAVPIPNWPVGVRVTDFGAVPDDGKDDSQAFIDAIAACPDFHAVLVPKGKFTIEQQITPQRDHFVLRGEDMFESVLFFPKYLDEINIQQIGWSEGKERNTGTEGGFITMDGGTEKSIENLSLVFRDQRKGGVWEYLGADPLAYTGGVTDSWVRNVYIKNYDLGFKVTRANNLSVINLILDQFVGRRSVVGSAPKGPVGTVPVDEYGETLIISGFDALFGVMPRAVNNSLFHNIDIRGYVMQPIDMNDFPRNNVFSKIRAELRTIGYHGGGSEYNLYTDMNHFVSGVGVNRRTHETYWGIDYKLSEEGYNSENFLIFVGYGDNWPKKITETIWYEPINPQKLEPRNLYLAQAKLLGKPLPEDFPRSMSPAHEAEVFRLLPIEDKNPARKPNDASLPIHGSFFKFDLTGIDLKELAHVRFRINLLQVRNTPFTLGVFAVADDSWSEASLVSENAPEVGSEIDSVRLNEGEENRVVEFDVTSFVRDQVVNGEGVVSLCLKKTDGNGSLVFLRSLEGGARPELIIERVPSSVPGPPRAPQGIQSTPLVGNIILDWEDNPEADVATYNVYRNPVVIGKEGYAESHASGLVTSDFVDIQSSGDWKIGMMDHRQVYKYKITAVDKHGYESPRSMEFVAATQHPSNQPPAFVETASLPNGTVGQTYLASLASMAGDPESDPLYFMKVSGPDWLHVAQDGTLSGTPTPSDAGTQEFTLQVTAIGGSQIKEESLVVHPAASTGSSPEG